MFDPNKYDNTDSQKSESSSSKTFPEKIIQIIEGLQKVRPLIFRECESMEAHIQKNPNTNAKEPFEKKLGGWSRILNGLAIVEDMYGVKK